MKTHDRRDVHVAIIMDGNGRWARARRLPRGAGHREGAKAVRAVVEKAADPSTGIGALTLYAFSSDNWARPRDEVSGVMSLLDDYLRRESARCAENGVRILVTGRRDRLTAGLVSEVERAEAVTADAMGLTLRLAIDYSSRDQIVRAAALAAARPDPSAPLTWDHFRELLGAAGSHPGPVPDVDLLIRTGGEQRLSDFLLWECAYAELYFTDALWPDFGAPELEAALSEFRRRHRRFGRVLEEAV